MMTRKITIMALIAGIVLGAAATEGFNVYRQSQDSYRQSRESQIFQQRARCKAVADAYVKGNTDLRDNSAMGTSVTLEKVDYSPARNSCLAAVETTRFFSGGGTENESVEDLLSGETLLSVETENSVKGTDDDDAGRFIFLPRVWDYVMNNASQPIELEKEWALMESKNPESTPKEREQRSRELEALMHPKNPPKAASPASSVAEPNDWQTAPAMEYDAKGKPIASPQSPGTGK